MAWLADKSPEDERELVDGSQEGVSQVEQVGSTVSENHPGSHVLSLAAGL